MIDATLLPVEPPRRLHFGWLGPALFRPRSTFSKIALYDHAAWLTPLLLFTCIILVRVVVAGPLQLAASQAGLQATPSGFANMSPDQQQQVLAAQSQAQSLLNGPMFIYVFPAVLGVLGIWVGWLITFGALHLVLTMLGGRGSTRSTMNIVAWASLAFAVRELLRIGYMLVAQHVIAAPGLSGFSPAGVALSPFLGALLGQVDIYLFWYMTLIVLGVAASDKLTRPKALGGVVFTIALLMLIQAFPGLVAGLFSGVAQGG